MPVATDCRSSSPVGVHFGGKTAARTPPLRCKNAGFSSQSASSEECAPQMGESHTTPHRITPRRFSGVVRFWKERVNGIDASPVPLPGVLSKNQGESSVITPSTPIIPEGLAPLPESIALATPTLSSVKTLKDWSPPIAGQISPTPRRLVNLLEGDETLDHHDGDASPDPFFAEDGVSPGTFAQWNLGSCTPGAKPRRQRWIDASSASTASRTPERSNLFTPTWEASSSVSVMSIATPDKFGQDSPNVETEMELMLDLANHVPCNMMDRLTDVLQSARTSLVIAEEDLQEEEEDAIVEEGEVEEEAEEDEDEEGDEMAELASAEPFFIWLCRQSVLVTATVAMLGLAFAGGFVTRGVLDGYSSAHNFDNYRIQNGAMAGEVHQQQSPQLLVGGGWPQVATARALPVPGTHRADPFPCMHDEHVLENLHLSKSDVTRLSSQQSDPVSNMKVGKEYTVAESISAGLRFNYSSWSPHTVRSEAFCRRQPWLEVDTTVVSELGQALLELGRVVSDHRVQSPTTLSELDVADTRAPTTHAAMQIIEERFGPDVDAAEKRLINDLDSAAGFLTMSSTAPRNLEHARAAEERLTGEVASAELERRCLDAAATWRANGNTSGAVTYMYPSVLFAEQACRAASLGARREEYNVEGNEFDWALFEATY